jgi:uncharacterized protein
MDDPVLHHALFLLATFAGALVAGLAGFAFGLIAAAVWLHILPPLQTAALIIAFGLLVQGIAVWKLRHALSWGRLWPFLLGAAFGVPLGVTILAWANVAQSRSGSACSSSSTAPTASRDRHWDRFEAAALRSTPV